MAPIDHTPPVSPPAMHRADQQQQAQGRAWTRYQVRPGDSLVKIAERHHASVAALVARNRVADPRHLEVGWVLQVPGAPAPPRSSATGTAHRPAPRPAASHKAPSRVLRTHVVRPGDSLIALGVRYGVGWSALMKANGLSDPHRIAVGRVLKVPARAGSTAPARPRAAKPAPGSRRAASDSTFLGRTYPDHVVDAARRNRQTLQHLPVPSRSQTRDLVVRTARRYGVDPRLALAVAWQESGWNQRAVSVANAVGVMQVMPGTGEWCGRMVGRDLDLLSARDNITAGVVLLRWLTTHAGSRDEAVAGYYQGLGGVRRNGMYPDTRAYVSSVNSHLTRF